MSTTYEASAAQIIERYENAELEFAGAVDGVKAALLVDNGMTSEDEDGNDVPDYDELKRRGAEAVAAAVVHSRDERATVGLTSGDLFDQVLPNHPALDEANLIELKAMADLTRYVWGITQPAPNGYVQGRLTDGLVLVRSKVHRGNDPVEVVFVTDDDELILTGRLQPEIDALVNKAARLGAAATMVVMRRPELAAATRRAITAGARKAANASQPAVPELLELPATTDEA